MVQGVTVQGAPYTVTGVAVTCLGQDGVVLKLARGVNGYLVLSLPRALHKMGLFTGSGPYAGRTVGPATVTVCLSAVCPSGPPCQSRYSTCIRWGFSPRALHKMGLFKSQG